MNTEGVLVRGEAQHLLVRLVARLWHPVQVCQPVYAPSCRPVQVSQALRSAGCWHRDKRRVIAIERHLCLTDWRQRFIRRRL